MSIASEYTKIAKLALYYPEGWSTPGAEISRFGDLKIVRDEFSPKEALELAAWINDTFSEVTPKPGSGDQ